MLVRRMPLSGLEGVDIMGKIVTKFGGSSLSDANQFYKVKQILEMDERRVFVVPSAPGKRFPEDKKITDLLYQTHALMSEGKDTTETFSEIRKRYIDISNDLAVKLPITQYLDVVFNDIQNGASADYCASRGEYLNGLILADFLSFEFVDPKECIFFKEDGSFDSEKTNEVLAQRLNNVTNAVVPGFYGSMPDGSIRTFSRGGSDITGAIVARAINAEVYENWTDVSGFLMADPRIVNNAKVMQFLSYRELRELSYMGATVLHEESVFPVQRAGIPTNIRNTNAPLDKGTFIGRNFNDVKNPYTITGVAGKCGFSVLSIEKSMMNAERGFGRKVLQAIEEVGLPFEHLPTGIDTLCVVLSTEELAPVREKVVSRIMDLASPDTLTIHDEMGIIATVGRGMVHNPGTAAKLFTALSRENVNVRMIDQGSSELSILVGVNEEDFERAISAIYHEFVKA